MFGGSEMTSDQVDALITAITRLSYGPTSGPTGLEGIGMALAGEEFRYPIGKAIESLAEALSDVASALQNLEVTLSADTPP
jgi:hypothetical protein